MMTGAVTALREARIRLRVRSPGAKLIVDVDALVDTGYSGALTLPDAMVNSLGLIRQSGGQARLADGSVRTFHVCPAELEWDGLWRPVTVSAVGNDVLLGMRLLTGHSLQVEVVPGGSVEIERLP